MIPVQADVSYVRDDVRAKLDDWALIRDCIAGQRAIKDGGVTYLPMPNPTDTSAQNVTRYLQYLQRAVFYNVTRHTHTGLTSLAFIDEPTITMPDSLADMLVDVDGAGVTLLQQMQSVLGQVTAFGRCGLLADYPAVNKTISRAEMQDGLWVRPIIRTYAPENIINWRTMSIGARSVPCLIVLSETYDVIGSDGFSVTRAKQWRVLQLLPTTRGGLQHVVTIFQDSDKGKQAVAQFVVRDTNGVPLQYIPFVAIGSQNNDLGVDDPPMLDLATMNIAHYRNSADYEESVFMCGQPTPTVTSMTKEWWEDILNKTIRLGSCSAVPLPAGSTLQLVQPSPNGLVREAMQDKERQMVALGARLIQSREVQRTATEARIETASEMSVLTTCANNVASGYQQALTWASQFIPGASGEITVDIHANAALDRLSPAERQQLIADLQAGTLSWSEVRTQLRRDGVASLDDTIAAAEIAARKKLQQSPAVQAPTQQ
jgi:hypothetical protein